MEIDLDINNYNLKDILKLFNINYHFTIDDLKKCKKTVLNLHPDKSNLDKNYFLFYSKAYRILVNIFEFKNKQKKLNENTEYSFLNNDDSSKKKIIENLIKSKKDNFNEWFNKEFEKINIKNESDSNGYGNWLKSEEDLHEVSSKNRNKEFENIKSKNFKIIEQKDISGLENSYYDEIDGSAPQYYQSNLFSQLQYEDLKKAHTENVIPISENYINKIKTYNNVDELSRDRNINIKPKSKEESDNLLSLNKQNEDKKYTEMAYKINKQQQEIENNNNEFWKNLKLLN